MFHARTIFVLTWLSIPVFAFAASDPDDLIALALERNPELQAAQKKYEAALQRPRAESALPDPMVGMGYNASGYPLPGAGLGREPVANIGVMVTQEVPYPGKRGLRAQMARKEAEAEWSTYQALRLDVMARVRIAWYRLLHGYQMVEVLSRNRQVLDRMIEVAQGRYSIGKGMQSEIFQMQTQASIIETQRLQFQSQIRTATAQANALLHRAPGAVIERPTDDPTHEVLPLFEKILDFALNNAPMLERDQKMIERAETGVRAARRDWYPDLAFTGGYYNMGSMPAMYMFRTDVRVPLWGKKQRAAVTESVANLEGSRHTYEASEQSLAARLREDFEMASTALQLMHLYADTVIPQANLGMESALTSYQTGGGAYEAAFRSFMTAVEYEMNYHEQMMNFHMALSRMEQMSSMKLVRSRFALHGEAKAK